MTSPDTLVLVAYFAVTFGAGVWFARSSATGLRSYFLGDNQQKWWMLACSGSATNYSVDGTVWMISMLMVLGMKSWWTTLIWWMPSSIVLMSFTAIWIWRLNIVLGCIGMYSLYLSPVYLLGRWYGEAALAFGIFAATCVALYFTWLKKLPEK